MNQDKGVKISTIIIAVLVAVIIGIVGIGYLIFNQTNLVESTKNLVVKTINPSYMYTTNGEGEDALNNPAHLTVYGNKVYVSDSGNGRIAVLDYKGKIISKFGAGKLQRPFGITNDDKGNIYVVDIATSRVSVFDSQGKFIKNFGEKSLGRPVVVAYKAGKFYFTDISDMKIKVLDDTGKLIQEFGQKGDQPGQLSYPNGITVDDQGKVYVADSNNNRIEVFDKDGKVILATKYDGKDDKFMYTIPRGISIDNSGNIYVANTLAGLITVSNQKGERIRVINYASDDTDPFRIPNSTYVDSRGRLYIVDSGYNRIVTFSLK